MQFFNERTKDMGLLSTEAEVGLSSRNIEYFKNLGYEIPYKLNKYGKLIVPIGAKLIVSVNHLYPYSKARVNVECDCCKKKYLTTYCNYTVSNHDGLIYCKECATTVLNSKEGSWHWDKNKTDEERQKGRNIEGYIDFVKAVLARDNYTCQCCGKKSSNDMVAHHLDGYDWCKDRRVDVTNGIALCGNCHKNFHSVYGMGGNTKRQFEEWLGHTVDVLAEYNYELPTAKQVYCIEENKIYDSAYQLAQEWNMWFSSIYQACNYSSNYLNSIETLNNKVKSVKGKHVLWYDDYIKASEEKIESYLQNNKAKHYNVKVICITTKEVFDSISQASREYKIPKIGIYECCDNKKKQHKKRDGTITQWMYYDEYLKQFEESA